MEIKKAKLRFKCAISATVDMSPEDYGMKDEPSDADILRIEKRNFLPEILPMLLEDPKTRISCTITLVDLHGLPKAEIFWEEND